VGNGDSRFLLNFGMVKSPIKVFLGDKIFVPYTEKNLKLGLYRIQTVNDTSLLITDICFMEIKNGQIYVT
jgi:hypothetical protein